MRYSEGPIVGGQSGPYNQSERTSIYQQHLEGLILSQKVYRCFCSQEDLEKKRLDQIAKKLPPRYDRTCLNLSDDHIKQKIAFGKKFIWRFKVDTQKIVEINTLERGVLKFDLKNFSDFALTRQDESFTFLFANFVDDWLMKISHVIRGEDHLTNTAMQAALFDTKGKVRGILFRMKTEKSGTRTPVFQIGIMSTKLNKIVNTTVSINLHGLKGAWEKAVTFYAEHKKISKRSPIFKKLLRAQPTRAQLEALKKKRKRKR